MVFAHRFTFRAIFEYAEIARWHCCNLTYIMTTFVGAKIRDWSKLAVNVRGDKRLGWTTESYTRVRLISLSGTH